MATKEYSDELLEGLTDEERAALEEDEAEDEAASDATDEEKEGDADDAKDQGSEAAQEDADGGDAGKADAGEADGGDGAGDGDGGDAGQAAADAPATDPAAPLLVAEAPADADTKLKEIADKKASLVEQFDNGDITAKEYQTQLDALSKQEREIELKLHEAQIAQKLAEQQRVNQWLTQVKEFTTRDYPEYGKSKFLWIALDTAVKEVGSDPANAELSGAEILRKAHERVVADLGDAVFKSRAATGKPAAKAEGKPLKGSKATPPPTLAKVPAAEHNDVENGKYAVLDRLAETDPLALEERLMKMSEAERDAYLARA